MTTFTGWITSNSKVSLGEAKAHVYARAVVSTNGDQSSKRISSTTCTDAFIKVEGNKACLHSGVMIWPEYRH